MTDFKALSNELDCAAITNPAERQRALGAIWEKVKDEKDNAWGLFIKGRMLMIMNQSPHFCVMYLYKAIELDPKLYQAMSTLGLLLRLSQKYPEALAMMRRAEETVRDDDEATPTAKATCAADLGGLLQVMGDTEGAEAALRRAIKDDEDYWLAYSSLAVLQEKMGSLDDAMDTLQTAIDRLPKPHPTEGFSKEELQCLFAAGVLRTRREEWELAIGIFARAWNANPDKWNILTKIIQCHAAVRNVEERNSHIRQLYTLALSGKIRADRYCREQISTPHGTILVVELFKLEYDKGYPVVFMQWEKATADKSLPHMVSMGSNEAMNAIQREKGLLSDKYRLYHIDAHFDKGAYHAIEFIISEKKPTFDEIRQKMLDGMLGKAEPVQDSPLKASKELN